VADWALYMFGGATIIDGSFMRSFLFPKYLESKLCFACNCESRAERSMLPIFSYPIVRCRVVGQFV
jgi:hypothetical protein